MRSILVSLVLFFIPFFASAASPLDGAIVPNCSFGPFKGACGFCDIFQLGQNIINFAVAFSALVATIMFVYAGVLYFSASAKQDNIKKAHGIFWKVFLGFIFILGAWLIVSVIMSTLLDEDFSPWNGFQQCGASSSLQQSSFVPVPSDGITTVPTPTPAPSAPSPAPSSPQTSQQWCFDADGKSQCFGTLSECVVGLGFAQNSGASVSQCSQSPQTQGGATTPNN